ncbi:MAG: HIT family protein [Deltaproteobacteria bacterium]
MDFLWSPWRFRYVSEEMGTGDCFLCQAVKADPSEDRAHRVLFRGHRNFVILNLFPYTTGHTMVAPYDHVGDLAALDREQASEMMELAQRVQAALKAIYHPDGYNLGMNLGQCAGAGLKDHLHLHVLPRWSGDASFMTAVGETRVLPEDLDSTYEKLLKIFGK